MGIRLMLAFAVTSLSLRSPFDIRVLHMVPITDHLGGLDLLLKDYRQLGSWGRR